MNIYTRPRRWWLREQVFCLTLWPAWLAKKLCDHRGAREMGEIPDDEDVLLTSCQDCYSLVESEVKA